MSSELSHLHFLETMPARCVLYRSHHSVLPVPRCLQYPDTAAVQTPSISSRYAALFPLWLLLALPLLSTKFILLRWALAGSSCANCTARHPDDVSRHTKTAAPGGAGLALPGGGRGLLPTPAHAGARWVCWALEARAASQPRRQGLRRECRAAAKCSPALPMFSMPFCFAGGAQTSSSSACVRGCWEQARSLFIFFLHKATKPKLSQKSKQARAH